MKKAQLKAALKLLSKGEDLLRKGGIIRTTKIVAELGEYYAQRRFALGPADSNI